MAKQPMFKPNLTEAEQNARGSVSPLGGAALPADGKRFNIWGNRAVSMRDATTAMKNQQMKAHGIPKDKFPNK